MSESEAQSPESRLAPVYAGAYPALHDVFVPAPERTRRFGITHWMKTHSSLPLNSF